MSTGEDYGRSMMYEIFIRRAYRYHNRTRRNGAEVGIMVNLINAEKGERQRWLPEYEEQFSEVSSHINKALEKYLKLKLNDVERQSILSLIHRLSQAQNSSQLLSIVDDGLEATQRFKEY